MKQIKLSITTDKKKTDIVIKFTDMDKYKQHLAEFKDIVEIAKEGGTEGVDIKVTEKKL